MMADLQTYLPFLLAGYFLFSLGLVSPGPNILSIIGTSMGVSRSAGILIACGISTGSFIWATLAITGVTAMMAAYAPFAVALKILGGLYLFWLGTKYWRAARANVSLAVGEGSVEVSLYRYYMRGLLIQLTNAKAILSWIAIISIVSQPDAPILISVVYILGCTVLAFAGHIAWAVLFSTRGVVSFYDRFKRVFNIVLGGLLGAVGAGLVVNAFKSGAKAT